jgi:integrase
MPRLEKRLTETIAQKCARPSTGYSIYWCPDTPGFGVRVTCNGSRAWIHEQRFKGKTVRATLAPVSGSGRGAISAELARKLAIQRSGELVQGKDPAVEQRAAAKLEKSAGLIFADALRQYIADDATRERPLKDRTKHDYLGMIEPEGVSDSGRRHGPGELASIASTRLDKLTGAAVKTLYQSLQKRGPTRAAYAIRVLRATLNYHGVRLTDDPFDRATPGRDRIRLPAARKRDRVISNEKLGAWWKACSAAENGDKFKLLLLAGMRPGELSAVRVADVDLNGDRIALADTKNRKPFTILLSTQARRIVTVRVEGKEPEDLLFDQAANPHRSQAAIIKQSGVPFSPHDCRRTFISIAAALVPGYVVKRLVNHADGNDITAGHYVRLDEATLRAAWQTVADFIESKVVGARTTRKNKKRRPAKILPFQPRVAA